jgi:outer membrane autotransporter protein
MAFARSNISAAASPACHFNWRKALLATTALVALAASMDTASAQATIDSGTTVTVPGTQASPWNVGGLLAVGDTGSGTLNIGDGVNAGVVTSSAAVLGIASTATGVVNISGAGSLWDIGGSSLTIGLAGTGQLTISGGGRLESGLSIIGYDASALGTVTVTGAGSIWNISSDLAIGNLGQGALTISNGGTVNSGRATIGASAASGNVTVTGAGSTWTTTGDLSIGVGGVNSTGALTVSAGGGVNVVGDALIGADAGSQGHVSVSGSGSIWNVSGSFDVGNAGSGILDIDANASVVVTSGAAALGIASTATGVVNISGAGSLWDIGGSSLTIGVAGTGQLTISGGGRLESGLSIIGENASALGTVTVTGAGSIWNVSSDLAIGNVGDGSLLIQNGGAVTGTNGYIGNSQNSTGAVTVDGANSLWTNTGVIGVGNDGTGSLLIQNGGNVTAGFVDIGAATNGVGVATVDGANSLLDISGDLHVGSLGLGVLTIVNGGKVIDVQAYIGNGPGYLSSATVDGSNSFWISSGGLYVGNGGQGILTISNGGTVVAQTAGLGLLANSAGSVTVDGSNSNLTIGNNLVVGYQGTGVLTVSNGGKVSAGGIIGIAEQAGSSGTINIGGATTPVAPGTLNVTSITFGSGDGKLNFNHTSSNYVFTPQISGSGFIRQAAGTTILTADSSAFNGSTQVVGGKLVVNGQLGGGIDVATGGTLGGSGTLTGSVFVGGMGSGTIAPGNSIGTLTVGNITFEASSIYEVEANAAGQSDKVVASGTATINGGTVKVLAGAGNYAAATTYTILTANGGRSGAFDSVISNFAFLDPTLSYDPNNVYLTLTRNNTDFASVGLTRNQIASGGGVESLGYGSTVYNAVLSLSAPQARAAFDQLSGEVNASANTALVEDSRFLREAAIDRLRAAFDTVGATRAPVMAYAADAKLVSAPATTDRFAVWGNGFGSFGHWNGDGNTATLKRDIGGFVAGADGFVRDTWRLGLLTGYSRTAFNVKDRSSSGSSDDYHVGLYGGSQWSDLAFRTGVAYTWHDLSTSRFVIFPGLTDRPTGNTHAGTAQVFGELGYDFKAGRFAFEPFVNLAYVSLKVDGFTEQGGVAALTSSDSHVDTTFSTLGLRGSTGFTAGSVAGAVRAAFGWRHAFGDVTPLSTFAFVGGNPFTVAGVPIARDAAAVDAGLDFNLSAATILGISYGSQFASGAVDQTVRANLNIKF